MDICLGGHTFGNGHNYICDYTLTWETIHLRMDIYLGIYIYLGLDIDLGLDKYLEMDINFGLDIYLGMSIDLDGHIFEIEQ